MDTPKIHRDPAEDHHPHACYEGLVFIGYLVEDDETGETAEVFEPIPCRRCASR